MFAITLLLLTGTEQQQLQQAAAVLWPQERLSRAEICKRFTLAGVQTLVKMKTPESKCISASYADLHILHSCADRLRTMHTRIAPSS